MKENSLNKYEKLKGVTAVRNLFKDNDIASVFPIKAVYSFGKNKGKEIKVGFSVAKKKVNKAHKRNQIKRVLREGFRQCKDELFVDIKEEKIISIMFIYLGSKPFKYSDSQQKMQQLVKKINKNIQREN